MHQGQARGHLLLLATLASWLGGMLIGRRWRYLVKTPRQITEDFARQDVKPGFAEKLLMRLCIVLGALMIYASVTA